MGIECPRLRSDCINRPNKGITNCRYLVYNCNLMLYKILKSQLQTVKKFKVEKKIKRQISK